MGAGASYELGLPLVDELTIEFKKALFSLNYPANSFPVYQPDVFIVPATLNPDLIFDLDGTHQFPTFESRQNA